jgi:hypothetical protein
MKVAIVGLLVPLLAVSFACTGDGGAMSLDEYLTELDNIGADAEQRTNSIEDPDIGEDASLDEQKDALTDYFGAFRDITADVSDDLDALDPPDEAADEHDRFVASYEDLLDAIDEYEQSLEDAESLEDLSAAANATGVGDEASADLDDACNDLQQLADDNSIDVDLECDE